jgi:FtsP/CotA-like multicopper oxidase with cupredoxin domain
MTSPPDRLRQLLAGPSCFQETRFNRRELLLGAGSAGLAAVASRSSLAQTSLGQTSVGQTGPGQSPAPSADHTIRIAPISLEIGPNEVIKTTGYNDTVPGPALRLKEGKPVTIKVVNDSG